MTKKKATPAKRGPKPKAEGDRVEQLTIRLMPKLKFGLELLARAQRRSLSQSVEWAIQRSVNAFELGPDLSLGDLLEEAWNAPSEYKRISVIAQHLPTLLTFEEKATWDFIVESMEGWRLTYGINNECPEEPIRDETFIQVFVNPRLRSNKAPNLQRQERLLGAFDIFVEAAWPLLKSSAEQLASTGQDLNGRSLFLLLGLDLPPLVYVTHLLEAAERAEALIQKTAPIRSGTSSVGS